jgi:hypothetical protein
MVAPVRVLVVDHRGADLLGLAAVLGSDAVCSADRAE